MESDSTDQALPRWVAAMLAIPLCLVVVAAIECFLVPGQVYGRGQFGRFEVFLLGIDDGPGVLGDPILFQFFCAGLAWLAQRRPSHRKVWIVLSGLAAGAITVRIYGLLTEYPPFRGYLPFIAIYSALFLYLWWWSSALIVGGFDRGRRGLKRLLSWATAVVALVGAGAAYLLNNTLFHDAYLGLHVCTLLIAYLLLHAGVTLLLARVPRPKWSRARVNAAQLGALLALSVPFVLAQVVSGGERWESAQRGVRQFTLLGQAAAILEPAPSEQQAGEEVADDPDGVARFATGSGLPQLPATFALEDNNILLISIETFRFRDTSLADPQVATTPEMRAFAEADNYWFEHAYSAAPYTLQSISSIFAMTYPSAVDVTLGYNSWDGVVAGDNQLVAERLAAAGYATFWIGHDEKNLFKKLVKGLKQGFEHVTWAKPSDPVGDVKIVNAAIDRIEGMRSSGRRFFAWIFLGSPHHDYLKHYDDMPAATPHDRYLQEIRFADEQLGKLLDYLRTTHLLDKTVVIIHGDHGEEFGEHGKFHHSSLYSEVLHVPLVIHIPGVAGSRLEAPTSLTYLFPWLFLHGGPALAEAARSRMTTEFGPMMRETDNSVVAERLHRHHRRVALIHDGFSLVYDFLSGYKELYDLAADPKEHHDIYGRDREVTAELDRVLAGYRRVAAHLRRFAIGGRARRAAPPR